MLQHFTVLRYCNYNACYLFQIHMHLFTIRNTQIAEQNKVRRKAVTTLLLTTNKFHLKAEHVQILSHSQNTVQRPADFLTRPQT